MQDWAKFAEDCFKTGMIEAIKRRFEQSYNNPLDKVVDQAIVDHGADVRNLVGEAVARALVSESFKQEFMAAVRTQLAKTLIQKFGGELEKVVNQLKSDPSTRARITVAIDEIIKEKTAV